MGELFDWKSGRLDWKHGVRRESKPLLPETGKTEERARAVRDTAVDQSKTISPEIQQLFNALQSVKEKIAGKAGEMGDILSVVSALEECNGEFDLYALDAPSNLHGLLEHRFRELVSEKQVSEDERDLLAEKIRILEDLLEKLRKVVFSK